MTTDNRPPVTVIGLGAMGRALAGAFLDGGHPTTVWNRTAARSEELVRRGATAAATVAEAVAASPLVVVCVLDHASVHAVLDAAPGVRDGVGEGVGDGAPGAPGGSGAGVLAGRTLVNLTNGTPAQARETARRVAGHGAEYVDGGIMAVPPMIGTPASLVLYSGSRESFRAHERAFEVLGAAMYLGPDPGRAALYDIALLSAMYGMFGGFFHALALAGSEGVPAAEFTPLVVSWLNAMTTSLPGMAKAVDSGDHSATGSSLRMQAVAFPNLLDASRDQGVDTALVEPMRALLDRGVAAGRGAGDVSGVVDLLRTGPAREGRDR
ncbi:NAD(P)-binding domain-containing protein [Streptosporangium sp. NPDC023615]|uniref:NAD(P)-dependent oxidoreductase n=1 Tax=Streptosporangium sp. NPDC023615 TaxID=3154794 RepID=UPI00341710B1